MASKSYGNRRAQTEMADKDVEAFDINQLPDGNKQDAIEEDLDDNVDLNNYKGIYINDEPGQKF